MKSILSKSLALLPALCIGAMATPLVSYAGYYYENCTGPSITATNIAASYCANVENIPIKSFTASVFSGVCEDSKSPVLNLYTEANCQSGLLKTVGVDSKKQCFEVDTTVLLMSYQDNGSINPGDKVKRNIELKTRSHILHPPRNPVCSVLDSRADASQPIPQRFSSTSCRTRDSVTDSSSGGTRDSADGSRHAPDGVSQGGGHEFGGASDTTVLRGGEGAVRHFNVVFSRDAP
ncbi:hypothetical protein BDV28DRAFT_163367 [Aspergillus coremiiformis]|uniref:Uncharacterized protein n=1 Tax=Aspergillus coremiiformis TaxID=138285 RepID=A0A5N6YWE7_9EURO|nr:hypothetical protein BDV28DRAFT_163367 [Aspergillus coremiiformis]